MQKQCQDRRPEMERAFTAFVEQVPAGLRALLSQSTIIPRWEKNHMSNFWIGGTAVVILAFVAIIALDHLSNKQKRDRTQP